MRFHTTAVIDGYDPAGVRRAVLDSLKDLTIDIETSGSLIMLSGLGPGSVSMNKDDVAVLTFEEQLDSLWIEVDGVFDGGYLEDHADQESKVCTKLERLFESVQSQFEVPRMRSPKKAVACEPQVVPTIVPKLEAVPAVEGVEPVVKLENPDSAIDSGRVDPPVSVVASDVPIIRGSAPAGFRRVGFLATSIAGVVVGAAGIVGIHSYIHTKNNRLPSAGTGSGAPTDVRSANGVRGMGWGENQPSGSGAGEMEDEHTTAIPHAPAPPRASFADPTTLLKHWAAAMRTRNAAEQSVFYNDPVDRYEGVSHVDWSTLEQKKQAAIANRRGLWTVKLERIDVEKRTVDEAQMSVIQHVIDQPTPFQISEEFVRTELRLRRVNGNWKIVSEEDVAVSPDPLGPRS